MLKAEEIIDLYWEVLHRPFPYEDCRTLMRSDRGRFNSLVPALDLYMSFIAGYSLSAANLGEGGGQELSLAIAKLQRSFFDNYPEYLPLVPSITEETTPALNLQLKTCDEIRWSLIELMEAELCKAESGH